MDFFMSGMGLVKKKIIIKIINSGFVFKLGTAAFNPHILLTEPLAFKAYSASNIFEMWIYEYINIQCICTFF